MTVNDSNYKSIDIFIELKFLVNGSMVNFGSIKEERISPLPSESPDETSRTNYPDSATSSDDDGTNDVPAAHPESNLALLTKLFPHLDKQILVMILKACENNLFKTIQSLIRDSGMRRYTPVFPRVPSIQHLPSQMPTRRLPMFQTMPHSPTFASPPQILQNSGLQFAAFGYPSPMSFHDTNPVGFVPRVHGNPYNIPGTKHPWCFPVPDQPLNKKPMLSRSVVEPSELTKTGVIPDCTRCHNFVNVGDKFCSQCGNSV